MTSTTVDSEWTESSDCKGVWTRPLDPIEKFCYSAATNSTKKLGREAVALTTSIQLEVPDTLTNASLIELLRQAWLWIRYELPDIATTAGDGQRRYQTMDEAGITSWLNETLIVSDKSVENIRFEATPARYALLYWLPASSELVLYLSHWRIDGLGCVMVLHRILSLIVSPPASMPGFGDEAIRLSTSLASAFQPPADKIIAIQEQGKERSDSLKRLELDKSLLLQRISDPPAEKSIGHRQVRLQFTVEESSRILATCRKEGHTVTAGIHAAYALALRLQNRRNNESSDPSTYSSSGRISFRRFLSSPYNSPTHAVSMFTGVDFMSIPILDSFTTTASAFSDSYRAMLSAVRDGEGPSMNAMFSTLAEDPDGLEVLMGLPYLTSVGNLDSRLQSNYISSDGKMKVGVKDYSFSATQLGKGVAGFLWTIGGRLILEVGFNGAIYDQRTIEAFLKDVKELVVRELC